MTLKLDCNICAASLEADDLAIRRGIITCQYCNTILRITEKGAEAYAEEIKHRPLPDSVSIKQDKSGHITVKVPSYSGQSKKQQLISSVLFILILVLSFLALLQYTQQMPAYSRIPLLMLVGAGFVYIIAGLRNKRPGFSVDQDVVIPSFGSPKIPRTEIKQIFTIENPYNLPNGQKATNISLGVLSKDGSRTLLVSNIPDAITALQIEELVEVELGIFNLPVYGDTNLPKQEAWTEIKLDSDIESKDSALCEYCGNNSIITPKMRLRGFIVCEYCNGLTLLYKPGEKKAILGQPLDNLAHRQFRMEHKPNGVVIYPSLGNSPKPVVMLGNEKLYATRFDGTLFTLDTLDIEKIFVREMVHDPDEKAPFKWGDLSIKWQRFKNNWRKHYMEVNTYSGELDEESRWQLPFEFIQYQLMAHMNDGKDYWLINNIDEPQEALFLSQALMVSLSS